MLLSLGIITAIALVFAVTPDTPNPGLFKTTITFQVFAGTAIFSFLPILPFFPRGPAGDVKLLSLLHPFTAILLQVTPHTSVEFWHLGYYHIAHQECAAVVRFIASAIGTGCNVSSVIVTFRVIVGADFVPSIWERIIGTEVVLAIGCTHPRAIELPRYPIGGVRFVVVAHHKLRLYHQVVVDAGNTRSCIAGIAQE